MSDTTPEVTTAGEGPTTALARAGASRMPVSEMLVWLCAFAGLGAYLVGLWFPQVGQLAQP